MRRALALLLLALAAPAWGAVESHFVRSIADCTANGCGLEDGSSYANAWRGFADISFSATDGTATALDPEDVLYLCSPVFSLADQDTATVMLNPSANVSGTSSAYTTFNGDCSAFGGPKMAAMDGGGTHDRGFDVGSTQRTYIKITNIEIRNFDAYGIIEQGLATDSAFWVIDNVYIHDIRAPLARGLWSKSADMTLLNSRIWRTGEDNLYLEGDRFVMIGNDLQDGGLDAVGNQGDNMQFGVTEAENFLIVGNKFKAGVDMKQCALVGSTGLPTSGILAFNTCLGPKIDAQNHTAFFIRGTGTVQAYGNFARESRYLIYAADGLTLRAWGNVGHDLSSYGIQCGTGATNCELYNNTVGRAPVCFSTNSASGTSIIQNNIGVGCSTAGIQKNAGDTESHNTIFNSADMVQNETVTTTPAATTNATDPLFVGGASPVTPGGFRLRASSPLIGAGIYIPGLDDRDGQKFEVPPTRGGYRGPSLRARIQ